MKRFMNQETVMLVILCLVVLAVMFGATVAWFFRGSPVTIGDMELQADDLGDLYVWVKTEGAEISMQTVEEIAPASSGQLVSRRMSQTAGRIATENSVEELMEEEGYVELKKVGTGDNVVHKIDMHPVRQENIVERTFAPGSYGKVIFKILSKTSLIDGYRIKITPSVEAADRMPADFAQEDLLALVKSHIKFYAALGEEIYSDVILYSNECAFQYGEEETTVEGGNPIVYVNGLTGDIAEDEIKYVTLYWYWPYEYTDIPECLDILNEQSLFYKEFEKYSYQTIEENGEQKKIERAPVDKIESYDWDDTYIGNFAEQLTFHFDVEAIR